MLLIHKENTNIPYFFKIEQMVLPIFTAIFKLKSLAIDHNFTSSIPFSTKISDLNKMKIIYTKNQALNPLLGQLHILINR